MACIGQVPVLWLFTVNVNYATCGNNAEKPLDQTEARRAEKNSFETASPFPRVWITTPPKEMSLIFMIDCGHKELKIGEKMLPLRCYPSHDETEKVYKVSGAEKNEK